MNLTSADRLTIDTELGHAAEALKEGNDGKARVCARRAAGVALRSWFQSRGRATGPLSAQLLLKLASEDYALPEDVRRIAGRLAAQAGDPDPENRSADPIAEARAIIGAIESLPGRRDG